MSTNIGTIPGRREIPDSGHSRYVGNEMHLTRFSGGNNGVMLQIALGSPTGLGQGDNIQLIDAEVSQLKAVLDNWKEAPEKNRIVDMAYILTEFYLDSSSDPYVAAIPLSAGLRDDENNHRNLASQRIRSDFPDQRFSISKISKTGKEGALSILRAHKATLLDTHGLFGGGQALNTHHTYLNTQIEQLTQDE